MARELFSGRIPAELKRQLLTLATRTGRKMNDITEKALEAWLNKHENDEFGEDDHRRPKRQREGLQVMLDVELKRRAEALAANNKLDQPKRYPSNLTAVVEEALREYL